MAAASEGPPTLTGKSQIGVLEDLMSVEDLFPDSFHSLLAVSSRGGRGEGVVWFLLSGH